MKILSKLSLGAVGLALVASVVVAGCGVNPVAMKRKVEKVLDGPVAQTLICYQKALLRDRNLKGVVEAKFTVLPGSKKITNVSVVSSTLNDSATEQCLVNQIARLSFPFDPKVKLIVVWPFEFSPLN